MDDNQKQGGHNEDADKEVVEPKPQREWRPQDADKLDIKSYTRNRVRSAHVTEGTVFIPAKPKPTIQDKGHKRVAVYARVSTKSTEQVSSIENQTKYYTEKIEKTENWEMQEIYSDEGKSGTSMRKRDRFKQMIIDAGNKKMDMILCASVSRFARNVSDCIEQVRALKTMNPSHPVGVYFETENIYTLDPDSNQMLTMHAMLADWESANKSRRMILSYDQRICTGQYPVLDLLGYKHTIDGDLIIEKEGALTVKFIFYAYINGMSCEQIAKILTEKKRETLSGRTDWNAAMVKNIMQNERRWGDLQVRKTIVVDYVKGKTKKNEQDRDGAFVPNHHEGIVTPAVAKAAKMVSASGRRIDGGVMDISVIKEGALKGFVSVCPMWSGVDSQTFLEVCSEVYSQEEYIALQREAAIVTGKSHSNVSSFDFDGYEVANSAYFMSNSTPTVTFTSKNMHFNNTCLKRLNDCNYVEVLYHPILQALIVRACDENTPNAIRWNVGGGNTSVKFFAPAFCGAIYEQLTWINDYRFKFKGVMRQRGNSKLLLFFLDEPRIIVGTKKHSSDNQTTLSDGVQFIQYKTVENGGNNIEAEFALAYPEWCQNQIGISYALRKRRDSIVDNLTEKDINVNGQKVDNPLIGQLPTRDEIENEIQAMLAAM